MPGPIERLSTHVLDVAAGRPAEGVGVTLVRDGDAVELGRGTTDADGRVAQLNDEPLDPGDVTLSYDVAAYMTRTHGTVFHPRITVHVRLDGARSHYHLPVLAGPFSHTTYLGS
ncbi:hydroxyisourate hydrolase [Actinomycetospora chiangmaiensis]|uniref:hydroxyisourate hydrolase n=1 Tax=Actinomycetospora chiangmaiensis TaxID=402650 RepID=UPI00036E5397|nr:hydroxyisourate hydrolase [Actinomycetospora chiangmaiensis]